MVANIIDRYSAMSVNVGFCPYLSVNVLINMFLGGIAYAFGGEDTILEPHLSSFSRIIF